MSYFYDTNSGCPVALTTTFGQGRRTCMSDAAGASAWSYDDGGRVKIAKRQTGTLTRTFSFTYHLDNALKTVVYQGGRTVTYEPSSAGRLISAIDSGIGVTYAGGALYAPQGALEYATHGAAGLNRALVYNNRLQPSLVTVGTPTQTVMDLAYNFNPGANNGNVIDITNNLDGGRSQSFGYDNLNRLETAKTQATTGDRCFGETFGYDKWANLLSIGRITPAYDACSQEFLLVGVDGKNQINNQGYGYDAAGNMTDDTSHDYTYDAENRLVTVDAGTTATYSYDGDGQRVQKSSGTLYWYGPGGEVLQETDAAGTLLRDFIYFNGQRVARREANNTVYFFFSDHLGSARAVTDASGSVVEQSDFYPFGREIVITDLLQGTQDNPYKFTGQERDPETSLDYFGARHYTYALGRFLQPDEFEGGPVDAFSPNDPLPPGPLPYADISNPQSLNKYAYTYNNPMRYTDPSGHCVWDLCAVESYVVATAAVTVAVVAVNQTLQTPQGQELLGDTQQLIGRGLEQLASSLTFSMGADEAGQRARDAAGKLADAVGSGEITGEGEKSPEKALEHANGLSAAAERLGELQGDLDKATGKKERDRINEKIDKEVKAIKGHLKEVKQKWEDIVGGG